ncbi:MAG TPA: translation elongation factor G [Lachnospiraceae bacterium]|nr:translation elongation factor G [Lachnospiraceae bacterium]
MAETSENKSKKHISIGLLAHVDSGKTTLAESILFLSGSIRKPGRVDHGDAFLDTFELERARGITIFSKQAVCRLGDLEVTLLDTPGHVDFSAEMERTLKVLDYAVLVISGADGVQGHVQTLWRMLEGYKIPVFLFVNKMDQEGTDRSALLAELRKRLDSRCIDFTVDMNTEAFQEELAMCDEKLLECYLEGQRAETKEIQRLIANRQIFPCYFGSALRMTGVSELLEGIEKYACPPVYPKEFGAKIYKISRDAQGNRLTHLKVTGGTLKVKMALTGRTEEIWEEKVDQIRIYSGSGFRMVQEAAAGTVCAVTGLEHTRAGQSLGAEPQPDQPMLEPVLTYQIRLPEEVDVHRMLRNLRELEEEEPQLHIVWEEQTQEIHAQVMGEIQIEILKSMILERYGVDVVFDSGSIVYKETIENAVEGVGHFEPLRHYAEVHLLLEPGERGSGLVFSSSCSEDTLDRNWQRLVLTHLREKQHRGVLTGSEITDMKITLIAGRAHIKHTEGGDFRQATYRAVRHGLKKAKSILLEPVYEYRLEVPSDMVGRALNDIQKMHGSFSGPEIEGEMSVLTGSAPVVCMRSYPQEVISYTRGKGRLSCTLRGYEPCHNTQEVLEAIGYDSEQDLENPTGSVFCAHGAGFTVGWEQVEDYMHIDCSPLPEPEPEIQAQEAVSSYRSSGIPYGWGDDKELEEIFNRTYGSGNQERNAWKRRNAAAPVRERNFSGPKREPEPEYLLVDGYNVIFAWEELKELAMINIESARDKLMDILSNYQGYRKCTLILVFDAYKVKGNPGVVMKYHNIHVVFTKEAETADQYIEKTVHEIGRKYRVTVATSDGMEQVIILGQGAGRMSAKGLREEIRAADIEIRDFIENRPVSGRNYLFEHLPGEMKELMEDVRLGKKKL